MIARLHISGHRGGIAFSRSYRVAMDQSSESSDIESEAHTPSAETPPFTPLASPPPTSPEPPPISYSDYHPPCPYNPTSTRYFDTGSQYVDPDDLMNPAEFSNSCTVQGGNVVNVAIEHYEPALNIDVPQEYSSNAATIAQTTIVIDEDDASSRGHNVQLYQQLIAEQDNAGALAVAEMQAELAAVGCAGVRKNKTLLGELDDNISSRSHLPESFTMLPVPEDRRPVPSPVEERIESTAIHNTHSWTDV
jgi:hypothetical protein